MKRKKRGRRDEEEEGIELCLWVVDDIPAQSPKFGLHSLTEKETLISIVFIAPKR